MQSSEHKIQSSDHKIHPSFRVDASALGGRVDQPLHADIPSPAQVSLPREGGFATARSGAFNLDEVVSCSSAYARVTARRSRSNGSILALATAVVEDLNILEVVTAKRIVAQISVTIPRDGSARRITLAGSRFEGLRLAGESCVPTLNGELHPSLGAGGGDELPLTWHNFLIAGQSQAERLLQRFERRAKDVFDWATNRYGGMQRSAPHPEEGDPVLCSLVDGFEESSSPVGHVIEIPGFGKILLGELRVSRHSVQLVSVRAELGCPVTGVVKGPTADMSGGGGEGTE